MHRPPRQTVVTATVLTALLGLAAHPGHGAERPRIQLAARSFELVEVSTPRPEPLKLPGAALEPIDWNTLDGWAVDDHAAAFATFLASCRPLLRTMAPKGETRPIYFALTHVAVGPLSAVDCRKGRPECSSKAIFVPCA
jgi:hypothetical protein